MVIRPAINARSCAAVSAKPMSVEMLAKRAIAGMRKDVLEIRPGLANALKLGSRIAPKFMLNQIGKSVDLMHARSRNSAISS